MNVATCKAATCQEQIIWCVTEQGKSAPMDRVPSADGRFQIVENDPETGEPLKKPLAKFVPNIQREALAGKLHTSHFVTCVAADQFRAAAKAKQ